MQAEFDRLGRMIETLGPTTRQGLAALVKASPELQEEIVSTTAVMNAVIPLLSLLESHPEGRPLLLSFLEGG